jgi:CheY-like chemotaxis protein
VPVTAERKVPLVLVADDEDMFRQILSRRLSADGYRVETAEDGEEAVAILQREEFVSLVLTDLCMPGIDGIGVLRRAKQKNPLTVVIMMTAYASTASAIAAVREGAYDYLQKPFDHLDQVATKIAQGLRQQQFEIQNRELIGKLDEMNRGLREVLVSRTREVNDLNDRFRQTESLLGDQLRLRDVAIWGFAQEASRALDVLDRALRAEALPGDAGWREVAEAVRARLVACLGKLSRAAIPATTTPESAPADAEASAAPAER